MLSFFLLRTPRDNFDIVALNSGCYCFGIVYCSIGIEDSCGHCGPMWTPRGSFGIVARASSSHQNQSWPAKVPGSSLNEWPPNQNDAGGADNGRRRLQLQLRRELHLVGGTLCSGEISCSFKQIHLKSLLLLPPFLRKQISDCTL